MYGGTGVQGYVEMRKLENDGEGEGEGGERGSKGGQVERTKRRVRGQRVE